MTTTTTYTVSGMTCGHCVSSVSAEVGALPGVSKVEVDLGTGGVQVTSDQPLDPEGIRAAVEEAGYQLATA
jgi:copper chaperone